MKPLKTQNYYEILGVERNATREEIRNAYELSRMTFTDDSLATYSLFSDEENQEILSLISKAFQTLYDPDTRREYDLFLTKVEGRPPERKLPPLEAPSLANRPPISVTLGGESPGMMAARQRRPPLHPERPATSGMPGPIVMPGASPALGREMAANRAPEPPAAVHTPREPTDAVNKYIESVTVYNGQVLGKIRKMRGFSIEDVAAHTKIRKTYIQYIEEEEFSLLPAPIYVKGFVNLIADMLGLATQEVADEFMAYYREQKK